MPGLFSWLSRRRSSRHQVSTRSRFGSYEQTEAAAETRLIARQPVSYEEGLAARRLPTHPPSYEAASRERPARYDDQKENALDPQTPPTYEQASEALVFTLDKDIRTFYQNMIAELHDESRLPLPGQADVSGVSGFLTERGHDWQNVRDVRLARQTELLAAYRQRLKRLLERIDRVKWQVDDPKTMGALYGKYAFTVNAYERYGKAYQRLARVPRTQMSPLAPGDAPFERWEK
jgi:hypothetical protein